MVQFETFVTCLTSSVMFSTHYTFASCFTYADVNCLCVKRKDSLSALMYNLHSCILLELYFCKTCFIKYK